MLLLVRRLLSTQSTLATGIRMEHPTIYAAYLFKHYSSQGVNYPLRVSIRTLHLVRYQLSMQSTLATCVLMLLCLAVYLFFHKG